MKDHRRRFRCFYFYFCDLFIFSPARKRSDIESWEGEIGDLVLAINVVRLALEAEEDNSAPSGTARIALEHLEEMADELKQKWQEDYASLKEAS